MKFFKDYFLALIVIFFAALYIGYFFTFGDYFIGAHRLLIAGKGVQEIHFGIITFIIFSFLPILMWKLVFNSEVPILKETLGVRLVLSVLAIAFTISLFISKGIFNAVANPLLQFEGETILDKHGKTILIEVLSLGIPFIVFLYLTKKIVFYFIKKFEGEVEHE
jgi:hypothetical protein